MGDFPDVACIEVHRDWEAVPEFVQLRGIVCRLFNDLAQGLLTGSGDPDLALAELLEVSREAIEIEDQFSPGRHVLTRLVDQEQNVVVAGLSTT